MKKLMCTLLAAVTAVGIVGCSLSDSQKQVIAGSSGRLCAMAWIAADTPSADDIASAKAVATVIRDGISTNGTVAYSETVYPVADAYITANVKPAQQPLARMAASALCGGLDLMFAANPDWAANAGPSAKLARAFCDGFIAGLATPASDPALQVMQRQQRQRLALSHR